MTSTLSSGLTRDTIIRISLLVLLSTIDYALTCYAVNAGIAHEANPVLSWLSLEGIGLFKTAGLLALTYFYWNRPGIIWGATLVMLLVVMWNIWCVV